MKLNLLQLFVLLFWPACMMMAQDKVNMKFGKPTKEEMQMTTYEAEPDAEAVVLCRLTDVEYSIQQTGYLVDYREKVRIKVLKPSGVRYAKVVVPFLKNTPIDNRNSSSKKVLKVDATDNNSVSSSFEEQAGAMTTADLDRYSEESVEDVKATAYNREDTALLSENILLAAHALGLGATYQAAPARMINDSAEAKEYLKTVFGFPENAELINIIIMGHPAEKPAIKDRDQSKGRIID